MSLGAIASLYRGYSLFRIYTYTEMLKIDYREPKKMIIWGEK